MSVRVQLTITTFTLGPFETNCYIVTVAGDPACWIVDASFEPGPIIETVRERGLQPTALILSHAHVDHIAGVADVVRAFAGLPVWMHEAEREWLNDPLLNLSAMMGQEVTAPGPDRLLRDGDELSLAGSSWQVLHTPGHSPGGITLYQRESGVAIVGDSLFAGSIGRTDFPGSDPAMLERSIRTMLYTLPEVTRVYPGHGASTTIGRERAGNPFVRG